MCGISGVFSADDHVSKYETALNHAASLLNHRGPDYRGTVSWPHFMAAHNRLAIIDTSNKAHQPMLSADGNYTLLFNGEIFNFQELKIELLSKGILFNSNSDTEVLLHLLIEKKEKAIPLLNGFFSFAFYDKNNNELLLVRDRFGEKPLYYSYYNSQLFFSSELNGLTSFPIPKNIHHQALSLYLQFSYIPAPYTIFESCKKLEPGYFIKISSNQFELKKYYQPETKNFEGSWNDAVAHLKNLTYDAVQKRLISDVPIASFLSGGIDSTIISGIAKELKPDLETYSIGFPDHAYFDESIFASLAAKHIGTKHQIIPITAKEMTLAIDPVINSFAEPFADSSSLPMYLLCREVRKKCTVALSGDGADELFAGYHKHHAFYQAQQKNLVNFLIKNLPFITFGNSGRDSNFRNKIRQLKKYREGLKLNLTDRYELWSSFTSIHDVNHLLLENNNLKKQSNFHFTDPNNLNEVLKNDISWVLSNDMLTKVDLMSMQHSLEVRSPFLDYRIVEFANSLPFHFKRNNRQGKLVLRKSFASFLPETLNNRSKKGFEIPLRKWMVNELNNRINQEWLHPERIKKQGIFNPDSIKKLVLNLNKGRMNEHTVWALIVFQQWWNNNIK